jgi:histidine triad (HIT) family protein
MSKDCIFCKIAKKEIKAAIEYEDESIIAFSDKNPQAPVHVLIIPKQHIGRVNDITDDSMALMGKMAMASKEIARKRGISDSGYRLVVNCGKDAGQLVEHLHMHLLGARGLGWPPG